MGEVAGVKGEGLGGEGGGGGEGGDVDAEDAGAEGEEVLGCGEADAAAAAGYYGGFVG